MTDPTPRRYSNTRPYDNEAAYYGQPPQVQAEQAQYFPPPPQHQPSYQRSRGSSVGSHHSNHAAQQYQQYPPQQPQQQLTPYTPSSTRQHYFPPAPPGQSAPNQLHPSEAYNQDPFAGRQRRTSATSTASRNSRKSTQSQRSHRSSVSHHSETQHRTGRKHGERATLGDSLFGIWDTLRSIIPVNKR